MSTIIGCSHQHREPDPPEQATDLIDATALLARDDVDLIVETMGGDEPAHGFKLDADRLAGDAALVVDRGADPTSSARTLERVATILSGESA